MSIREGEAVRGSTGALRSGYHNAKVFHTFLGGVAGVVGIESSVVSGVLNLESSGVDAPDWRPRHDKIYHEG
jgi:hypothetical protein